MSRKKKPGPSLTPEQVSEMFPDDSFVVARGQRGFKGALASGERVFCASWTRCEIREDDTLSFSVTHHRPQAFVADTAGHALRLMVDARLAAAAERVAEIEAKLAERRAELEEMQRGVDAASGASAGQKGPVAGKPAG